MLAAALVLSGPALADVLVVRASGPSAARYPVGKPIPDTTRITLQPHDEIVLLDAHGTRRLQGPGNFLASGGPAASGPSVAALVSSGATRRGRIGAVRGQPGSGPSVRPNVLFVDIAAPGATCMLPGKQLTLWRADSETVGTTTIAGGGAQAQLTWVKGQDSQPWPATVPVASGQAYQVTGVSVKPGGTALRFEPLEAMPDSLPAMAKALIAHGCAGQMDVLIATTSGGAAGQP